jgi:octaprenyl-diphosphate synthase
LLDIFGDETTLGKPAFGDFKEGKTTIAYIELYDKMNDSEKEALIKLFKQIPNEEEKTWLFGAFAKYDIKKQCEINAGAVMTEGLKAIEDSSAPAELKAKLREIAIKQLGRTF